MFAVDTRLFEFPSSRIDTCEEDTCICCSAHLQPHHPICTCKLFPWPFRAYTFPKKNTFETTKWTLDSMGDSIAFPVRIRWGGGGWGEMSHARTHALHIEQTRCARCVEMIFGLCICVSMAIRSGAMSESAAGVALQAQETDVYATRRTKKKWRRMQPSSSLTYLATLRS